MCFEAKVISEDSEASGVEIRTGMEEDIGVLEGQENTACWNS